MGQALTREDREAVQGLLRQLHTAGARYRHLLSTSADNWDYSTLSTSLDARMVDRHAELLDLFAVRRRRQRGWRGGCAAATRRGPTAGGRTHAALPLPQKIEAAYRAEHMEDLAERFKYLATQAGVHKWRIEVVRGRAGAGSARSAHPPPPAPQAFKALQDSVKFDNSAQMAAIHKDLRMLAAVNREKGHYLACMFSDELILKGNPIERKIDELLEDAASNVAALGGANRMVTSAIAGAAAAAAGLPAALAGGATAPAATPAPVAAEEAPTVKLVKRHTPGVPGAWVQIEVPITATGHVDDSKHEGYPVAFAVLEENHVCACGVIAAVTLVNIALGIVLAVL